MGDNLAADIAAELSPHPDIFELFQHYSHLYFDDALGAASVEYSSKRMTRCSPSWKQ